MRSLLLGKMSDRRALAVAAAGILACALLVVICSQAGPSGRSTGEAESAMLGSFVAESSERTDASTTSPLQPLSRKSLEPERNPSSIAFERFETAGLRVRVLTADGKPAVGVPVAMVSVYKHDREVDFWTTLTDGDGRALVDATQPSRNDREDRHRVVAAIPSAEPCESVVTWENFGEEHLLRLPPTGSVLVELFSTDGVPFSCGADVSVRRRGAKDSDTESPAIQDFMDNPEDGAMQTWSIASEVLFPWVGLGLPLMVAAEGGRADAGSRLAIAGPTAPGELVHVRFNDLPRFRTLRLPLLGLDGAPLPAATKVISGPAMFNAAEGLRWREEYSTDEGGVLSLSYSMGRMEREPGRSTSHPKRRSCSPARSSTSGMNGVASCASSHLSNSWKSRCFVKAK